MGVTRHQRRFWRLSVRHECLDLDGDISDWAKLWGDLNAEAPGAQVIFLNRVLEGETAA
jgi:hypothetical protein